MKKLMTDWWKRLEFWAYWGTCAEDAPPLISFSIEAYILEHKPFLYFTSNDTNRWKFLNLEIKLSLYWIHLALPFAKLPDYVPTGRARLRTRKIGELSGITKL